jgi:hypothetical protein
MDVDLRELRRTGPLYHRPDIDLARVVSRFAHWLMTDPEALRKHATPQVCKSIDAVAALYARLLCGENVPHSEWVRIPGKTTTHSDAWRPPVPIDDDQCGAGAGEHRWMCLLISVFAVHVNPVLTAFESRAFAFDGSA